jgi:hypothetical protein
MPRSRGPRTLQRTGRSDSCLGGGNSPALPGSKLSQRASFGTPIKHVSVIELNYNIQTVVDSLKLQSRPVWERSPHFYVTREVSAGMDRLDRVSDSMPASSAFATVDTGSRKSSRDCPPLCTTSKRLSASMYVCGYFPGPRPNNSSIFIELRLPPKTNALTRDRTTIIPPRTHNNRHVGVFGASSPLVTSCPGS